MNRLFFLAILAAPLMAGAHSEHEEHAEEMHAQHPPHEHGAARLDLALDGEALHLALDLPGMDALGFEHPPRTPQQNAALAQAKARLADTAALFIPTPAAACRAEPGRVEAHGFDAEAQGEHADFAARYVFHCAQAAALRDVQVELFRHFPSLETVDVQAATANGQSAATLTRQQSGFDLP